MTCYHPLKAWDVGRRTPAGKIKYRITPYAAEFTTDLDGNKVFDFVEIPCGKCTGCRLDYARQWAIRCMLESKGFDSNYFVTLTYDDDHLPNNGSLVPDDLKHFMYRLREYYSYNYNHDNIRFFACGEYGGQTFRPHYHLLLFNLPLYDLLPLFTSSLGNQLYTSKTLEKLWPYGFVSVGEVTMESCNYTARYIMKKQKGPDAKDSYKKLGLVPEFVRMSRRPGIGFDYYDKNVDKIYKYDSVYLSGRGYKPPRYFDKLYAVDHDMSSIKDTRKDSGIWSSLMEEVHTTLDHTEYLKVQEESLKARSEILNKRCLDDF